MYNNDTHLCGACDLSKSQRTKVVCTLNKYHRQTFKQKRCISKQTVVVKESNLMC